MKTEFEVKFLNVDHDEIRKKLISLRATMEQPMRLMKRAIIETADMKKKNAFIRVRDEGHKTTLTYKQFDDLSIDGAKEHEVVISDFQTTIDILAELGLLPRSMQESRRETWTLDNCEIVLDEWPWLNPYIEIEGENDKIVMKVSKKLGLSWVDDAVFGDVMVAYREQYVHLEDKDAISDIKLVRFGDPPPEMLTKK